MSYSEQVLSRATARLEARKGKEQRRQEAQRQRIYAESPRLREIDRSLRQATPKVIALAFRQGEDPTEALEQLRRENLLLQEEMKSLLRARSLPETALDDTPLCPLCGDSGWRGTQMCSCLGELCQEEQIKELSALFGMGEQSFETFSLNYYEETPWPDFGRSPRARMERVLSVCKDYAEQFGKYPANNLFFHGGTGLGKTYLSACIARVVSEKGRSVVYDTAGRIFAAFEEQKFSRDMDDVREARDLTRKYLKCDLLILDDLGSELTTPFVLSALYLLINTRLVEGRATIISSNYSLDELKGRYSPQILSRLEGEYMSLFFFGKDIRLQER